MRAIILGLFVLFCITAGEAVAEPSEPDKTVEGPNTEPTELTEPKGMQDIIDAFIATCVAVPSCDQSLDNDTAYLAREIPDYDEENAPSMVELKNALHESAAVDK